MHYGYMYMRTIEGGEEKKKKGQVSFHFSIDRSNSAHSSHIEMYLIRRWAV